MKITDTPVSTVNGPAEWFAGEVYMDRAVDPDGGVGTKASFVRFAPGARTHWHSHPHGQTLYVVEGICRCQTRGGEIVDLRPGAGVSFEPDELHWHGAAPGHFMTHLAVYDTDANGIGSNWAEPVSETEYLGE